jgi:hypothetical protein
LALGVCAVYRIQREIAYARVLTVATKLMLLNAELRTYAMSHSGVLPSSVDELKQSLGLSTSEFAMPAGLGNSQEAAKIHFIGGKQRIAEIGSGDVLAYFGPIDSTNHAWAVKWGATSNDRLVVLSTIETQKLDQGFRVSPAIEETIGQMSAE